MPLSYPTGFWNSEKEMDDMCSLVRKGHLYVQLALRRIPYIRGEHVSRACNTLAVLYLSLIIILVKRIRLLFSGKPKRYMLIHVFLLFS